MNRLDRRIIVSRRGLLTTTLGIFASTALVACFGKSPASRVPATMAPELSAAAPPTGTSLAATTQPENTSPTPAATAAEATVAPTRAVATTQAPSAVPSALSAQTKPTAAVPTVVSAQARSSPQESPRPSTSILSSNGFALYVRVTPATWPHLQPFARSGDLFWGHLTGVPRDVAAFTFGSYPVLQARGSDEVLRNYSAANLDGEYKDFDIALDEARKIRQYVDSYNQRNATSANFIPLRFTAFYHLNIIDAHPDIVKHPDVVIVGKTSWTASNMQQEAGSYIKLITQAGRIPGILLGNQTSVRGTRTKVLNTSSDTVAEFESVIAPAPQGLGLKVVSFFYPKDESTNLIDALKTFRNS